MRMASVNIKHCRMCAFCKYWYDPTNSAIEPSNPLAGFWHYDKDRREKCLKTNLSKSSFSSCRDYQCKI